MISSCSSFSLSVSQESVASFLEAIESGWRPETDCLGAASREIWGCLSWKGRNASKEFTKECLLKVEPYLLIQGKSNGWALEQTYLRSNIIRLFQDFVSLCGGFVSLTVIFLT